MKKFLDFICKNYWIFISYAVLGWIYEELLYLIRNHVIVNRGFLYGPYLPIYGFGMLIIYYVIRNFKEIKIKIKNINITPILVFIIIFVVTTIVEYGSHYILDTYFNIVLWNYKNYFLNIQGRVCLKGSIFFAIGGTICIYFIQPIIDKIYDKISERKKYPICFILLFIVLIDFLLTIFIC